MKARKLILPIALAMLTIPLFAEIIYVVNSQSRTLSRIDTNLDTVQNTFSILGNTPNRMVIGDPDLYVVNSGDNSVARIHSVTGARLASYLVEAGSNPWDLVLHEGYIYVSGLFSSKVYKMDANTGQVVASVGVGLSPEALCVAGGKLYVSNAGDYMQNYAGSSVSVIDMETFAVTSTIPTPLNPQYLVLHGDKLHVSSTGNWTDIGGAISIIDVGSDEVVHQIDLGGTPGNIFINADNIAWVADISGSTLFSYDANDYSIIHDAQSPFAGGGSDLAGNHEMLAVLVPNWGSNAMVNVLHPNLSPWKSFTVGMMPTDMKLETQAVSTADLQAAPAALKVYPNPARQGRILHLESKIALHAKLDVFNVRGQKVQSIQIRNGKGEISTGLLPAGCYFYRIGSDVGKTTGRFVISR